MQKNNSHYGVVASWSESKAMVRIQVTDSADCSGCTIASMCSKSDGLLVAVSGIKPEMVGKSVIVEPAVPTFWHAVSLLLVVPMVLLVTVLVACFLLGLEQWVGATAAAFFLALWYFILWLRRRSSSPEFRLVEVIGD